MGGDITAETLLRCGGTGGLRSRNTDGSAPVARACHILNTAVPWVEGKAKAQIPATLVTRPQ